MKLGILMSALEATLGVSGDPEMDVRFLDKYGEPVSIGLVSALTPYTEGQRRPVVTEVVLAEQEGELNTDVSQLVFYADQSARSIIPHRGIDERMTRRRLAQDRSDVTEAEALRFLRSIGVTI
jgi:hypothetical protein